MSESPLRPATPSKHQQPDRGSVPFPTPPKDAANDGAPGPRPQLKSKRSAVFYPSSTAQSNQKPFSRSAAKRQSVMALGSITHLQHMYSKMGLARKNKPSNVRGALTLAIGGDGTLLSESPPTSPDAEPPDLPATPMIPVNSRPAYPPITKPIQTDPDMLRPGVIFDLDAMCQLWSLVDLVKSTSDASSLPLPSPTLSLSASQAGSPFRRPLPLPSDIERAASPTPSAGSTTAAADQHVDLVQLLQTTTRTIRSVRNYLVSLPANVFSSDDDGADPLSLGGGHAGTGNNMGPGSLRRKKDEFRRTSMAFLPRPSTSPPRARDSSTALLGSIKEAPSDPPAPAATMTTTAQKGKGADPLALIRRSALEVLGVLREVEERCRLPPDDPAYAEAAAEASSTAVDAPSMATVGPGPQAVGENASGIGGTTTTSVWPRSSARTPSDHSGASDATGVAGTSVVIPPITVDASGTETEEGSTLTRDPLDAAGTSGGFLYRSDVKMKDLEREREVVRSYLETVDRVLFGPDGAEARASRGRSRGSRRGRGGRGKAKVKRRASEMALSSSKFGSLGLGMGPGGGGASEERRRASIATGLPASGTSSTIGTIGTIGDIEDEVDADLVDREAGGGLGTEAMAGAIGAELPAPMVKVGGGDAMSAEEVEGEEDEEESEGDEGEEHWPKWAQREPFPGGDLERAFHLLVSSVPAPLLPHLLGCIPASSTSPSRDLLLSILADGQLLCLAYNSALRRSRRPWGFIPAEEVHDVKAEEERERERERAKVAEEEKEGEGGGSEAEAPARSGGDGGATKAAAGKSKGGWTFRRTENLRFWAAALKLRYSIAFVAPVHSTAVASTSTSSAPNKARASMALASGLVGAMPASEGPSTNVVGAAPTLGRGAKEKEKEGIPFDARRIARKEEGWKDMLDGALVAWMGAVVGEVREEGR